MHFLLYDTSKLNGFWYSATHHVADMWSDDRTIRQYLQGRLVGCCIQTWGKCLSSTWSKFDFDCSHNRVKWLLAGSKEILILEETTRIEGELAPLRSLSLEITSILTLRCLSWPVLHLTDVIQLSHRSVVPSVHLFIMTGKLINTWRIYSFYFQLSMTVEWHAVCPHHCSDKCKNTRKLCKLLKWFVMKMTNIL